MIPVRNNKRRTFHVFVQNTYAELLRFKNEEALSSFNKLLMQLLPEINKYVKGKLQTAEEKGQLDKNRYDSDEIIDQLFIEYYDHFDEVKGETFLYAWLFKKADELINEILSEEEFDTYFFENIDKYTEPEWDEMVEKYSTDGDGDYELLEDFEGQDYPKNDYVLNHVFIDDKDIKLIEALDEKLNTQDKIKHEALVVNNMPDTMRTVYKLFNKHHFNVAEIALICNRSEQEVISFLEEATEKVKISFVNRYLNNK